MLGKAHDTAGFRSTLKVVMPLACDFMIIEKVKYIGRETWVNRNPIGFQVTPRMLWLVPWQIICQAAVFYPLIIQDGLTHRDKNLFSMEQRGYSTVHTTRYKIVNSTHEIEWVLKVNSTLPVMARTCQFCQNNSSLFISFSNFQILVSYTASCASVRTIMPRTADTANLKR